MLRSAIAADPAAEALAAATAAQGAAATAGAAAAAAQADADAAGLLAIAAQDDATAALARPTQTTHTFIINGGNTSDEVTTFPSDETFIKVTCSYEFGAVYLRELPLKKAVRIVNAYDSSQDLRIQAYYIPVDESEQRSINGGGNIIILTPGQATDIRLLNATELICVGGTVGIEA
jgi:hypothetical protein